MCKSRLCLSLTITPEALRSVAMASFFMSVIGPSPSTLVPLVELEPLVLPVETLSFDDPVFSPLAAALAAFSAWRLAFDAETGGILSSRTWTGRDSWVPGDLYRNASSFFRFFFLRDSLTNHVIRPYVLLFRRHVSGDRAGVVQGQPPSPDVEEGEQGLLQGYVPPCLRVGTRAANVLLRKRIALADPKGHQLYDDKDRPRTWNLRTHRIDEARMVSFVVPPGLADTRLKPYVYLGNASDGGTERPQPGQPGAPKMPAGGMNAAYYSRLVDRALLSKAK